MVKGPCPISQSWSGLAKANFYIINAALLYDRTTAIFFSGKQYAVLTFNLRGNDIDDHLSEFGSFSSRWPALSSFAAIECAFPDPATSQVILFSGQEYISVENSFFLGISGGDHLQTRSLLPIQLPLSSELQRVVSKWTALKPSGSCLSVAVSYIVCHSSHNTCRITNLVDSIVLACLDYPTVCSIDDVE